MTARLPQVFVWQAGGRQDCQSEYGFVR